MNESYIKKMNIKENLCMDLEQKAEEEYLSNNRPTKQQCIYLQQAAALRAELARMSIGEEKYYQQRKLQLINKKIEDVIREVDPEFFRKYKEKRDKENNNSGGSSNTNNTNNNLSNNISEDTKNWFKPAPKHSFDDVSGMHELKEELQECITNFKLKSIDEYLKLKKLHSFFFVGPPGCGKTYIIEAFAHELMEKDYKYISVSGSDIKSKYVGDAEKIITKIFDVAIENAPCILFIDEIDGVCKNRSLLNLPEYASSMTTSFLEGFNKINSAKKDIIFLGATNYPNQVDDAMLDRVELLRVPFPDADARKRIFAKNMGDILSLEEDVDFEYMSQITEKYNYRDIERLVEKLKRNIKKELCKIYDKDENAMVEALKSGEFKLTKEMFDAVKDEFIPTPKDEIEKELDEWENRFNRAEIG